MLFCPGIKYWLEDQWIPVTHTHTHNHIMFTHHPTVLTSTTLIQFPSLNILFRLLPQPRYDKNRLHWPLIAAAATVMGNGATHLHLLILLP